MVALVLLVLVHRRRAGAHKAHIAPQHVKKLRQLVNAGAADEFTHLGHAGVILHFEHQAVHFILGHQLLLAGLGVHVHAAQLVDVKIPPVAAHTLLFKKQRAGAFELERDGDHRDDRDADDTADDSAHHVHAALGDLVAQLQFNGAHRDDVAPGAAPQGPAQPRGARLVAAGFLNAVQQRQTEVHGQAHALHLVEIGDEALAAVHRHIDIDLVERLAPDPVHEVVERRLDLDAADFGGDRGGRGLQQRDAHDPAGPVLSDLGNQPLGPVRRCDDADERLHAPAALEPDEQSL